MVIHVAINGVSLSFRKVGSLYVCRGGGGGHVFVCCLVFFCVEYKVCEVFDGILVYFFLMGALKVGP